MKKPSKAVKFRKWFEEETEAEAEIMDKEAVLAYCKKYGFKFDCRQKWNNFTLNGFQIAFERL